MLHRCATLPPKNLTAHELSTWQGRARFVDVREAAEFTGELGHVSTAEHVPLSTLPRAAVSWERGQPVVVICRSGARSATAARVLEQLGFRAVMNLEGGMLAIHAAGLPVIR